MTPTLDPTTASEPAIRLWLATLPCPAAIHTDMESLEVACGRCGVQGDAGLALLWASEPCESEWHKDSGWRDRMALGGLQCPRRCENGRVPKDVGLATILNELRKVGVVFEIGPGEVNLVGYRQHWETEEELTQAALRAIAAQAKAGMR